MGPKQLNIVGLIAAAAIILCWMTAAALGQESRSWAWSDPAPHHWAACRVTVKVNSQWGPAIQGGSGVYVSQGDFRCVLTARHVISGAIELPTVHFLDGMEKSGEATICKNGSDLAAVLVTHPTIRPIPVAETAPADGDRVELVSFGGPEEKLQSLWMTVRGPGVYDCDAIAGDSGAGILNERHELVGIQTHGLGQRSLSPSWGVYRGTGGVSHGPVKSFVERVAARYGTEYG